ncbi:MAG: glycosyltransferase family 2 protein, partial [Bacilli bacterium]|nr:glycosyltransferase family 2 protein [Bacilli bacterium]
MSSALLIPIYEPNDKVLPFLKSFRKGDFDHFLVIDDGSGKDYQAKFQAIAEQTVFEVVSYPKNHGKGHALKTGFKKLFQEHPELEIVVTADGDGQHAYPDILRVKKVGEQHPKSLTIGCRDFSLPDVPERSRFGNRFSTGFLHLSTGATVSDTQSGLRAIPKALFSLALAVPGERYDYEMCFLTSCVKLFGVYEITIQTIYEENNAVSHFHPMPDSMRIYRPLWIYLLISMFRYSLSLVLFHFGYLWLLGIQPAPFALLTYSSIATAISAGLSLLLIAFLVFYSPGKRGAQIAHYLMMMAILEAAGLPLLFLFATTFPN